MATKAFETVYYVAQHKPYFRICGYTFNRRQAEALQKVIKKETGGEGLIVEFSRDELVRLGYTSYIPR